ncbi:hypothetical protein D3C84_853630 [compost metagenome]
MRSSSPLAISLLAQAMASRLLPVNSSAPPITTSTRPRQKPRPPSRRVTPKPSSLPVTTTVNNNAPKEMNAPASTASTSRVRLSARALATPISATRRAICCGW